jgi:hypothetical protein
MSSFDSDSNTALPYRSPDLQKVSRIFGARRLNRRCLLDVAKVFDTVWVDGLLYKLTVLNFPSYLV